MAAQWGPASATEHPRYRGHDDRYAHDRGFHDESNLEFGETRGQRQLPARSRASHGSESGMALRDHLLSEASDAIEFVRQARQRWAELEEHSFGHGKRSAQRSRTTRHRTRRDYRSSPTDSEDESVSSSAATIDACRSLLKAAARSGLTPEGLERHSRADRHYTSSKVHFSSDSGNGWAEHASNSRPGRASSAASGQWQPAASAGSGLQSTGGTAAVEAAISSAMAAAEAAQTAMARAQDEADQKELAERLVAAAVEAADQARMVIAASSSRVADLRRSARAETAPDMVAHTVFASITPTTDGAEEHKQSDDAEEDDIITTAGAAHDAAGALTSGDVDDASTGSRSIGIQTSREYGDASVDPEPRDELLTLMGNTDAADFQAGTGTIDTAPERQFEPRPRPRVVVRPVAVTHPKAVSSAVVAEPVVAEPVVAEPGVAEPVVAEPIVAEPGVAKPIVAEHHKQSHIERHRQRDDDSVSVFPERDRQTVTDSLEDDGSQWSSDDTTDEESGVDDDATDEESGVDDDAEEQDTDAYAGGRLDEEVHATAYAGGRLDEEVHATASRSDRRHRSSTASKSDRATRRRHSNRRHDGRARQPSSKSALEGKGRSRRRPVKNLPRPKHHESSQAKGNSVTARMAEVLLAGDEAEAKLRHAVTRAARAMQRSDRGSERRDTERRERRRAEREALDAKRSAGEATAVAESLRQRLEELTRVATRAAEEAAAAKQQAREARDSAAKDKRRMHRDLAAAEAAAAAAEQAAAARSRALRVLEEERFRDEVGAMERRSMGLTVLLQGAEAALASKAARKQARRAAREAEAAASARRSQDRVPRWIWASHERAVAKAEAEAEAAAKAKRRAVRALRSVEATVAHHRDGHHERGRAHVAPAVVDWAGAVDGAMPWEGGGTGVWAGGGGAASGHGHHNRQRPVSRHTGTRHRQHDVHTRRRAATAAYGGLAGEIRQSVAGEVIQPVAGDVTQSVAGDVRQSVAGDVRQPVAGEVRQSVAGEVQAATGRSFDGADVSGEGRDLWGPDGAHKRALSASRLGKRKPGSGSPDRRG